MSSQLDRIVHVGWDGTPSISQETIDLFVEKNRDYGENAVALGVKGQFSDIWRKIGKLRTALWDGKELQGEQPEEILMDLIGHCWLTIDILRQEGDGSKVVGHLDLNDDEMYLLEQLVLRSDISTRHADVLRKILVAADVESMDDAFERQNPGGE